jgi:uncharacterized protein
MRAPATIRLLPDGHRLHLNDGPIDLIIDADASADQIRRAYEAAGARFVTILDELCAELPLLRSRYLMNGVRGDTTSVVPRRLRRSWALAPGALGPSAAQICKSSGPVNRVLPLPTGRIARRMANAVSPHYGRCFITPMAAVAGAVAEAVLAAMTDAAQLDRAYVNNGGDIALHLAAGQSYTIGMVQRPEHPSLFGSFQISAATPVRGIATSGWRGRSFSLGVADAVTVLAESAAQADAAATIIANAVDLPGHPAILRIPAREIAPDSDLLDLPVTRGVGPLSTQEIHQALIAGEKVAEELRAQGLIHAAALCLQEHLCVLNILPRSCRDGLPRSSAINHEPQRESIRRRPQHA